MIKGYENKAVKPHTITIKLNADLKGKTSGSTVRVKTDTDGTPLDRYWRDRMKDSKIDNCVEVVQAKNKRIKKTEEDGG